MNKRIIMFLMLVLASLPFALFAAKTAAPHLPIDERVVADIRQTHFSLTFW